MRIVVRFMILLAVSGALPAKEAPRVLIVHSFGRDFAPFGEVAGRFREEFAKRYPGPYVLMDASLGMARSEVDDREVALGDYLEAIHAGRPPQLVVPIGAPAAVFCREHRDRLFPGSPLLILGVDVRRFKELEDTPNSARIGARLDLKSYMENILRLLPDTRHVHIVCGRSPFERFWEQELFEEWRQFETRVTLHSLSDLPVTRVCESVMSLPEGSVVFHAVMNLDAGGVPHEGESALRAIRRASNSPVFGPLPTQTGAGAIGGPVYAGLRLGEAGAAAAVKILGGTPASSLPVEILDDEPPGYDWRELKHWNIPLSRLPPGSAILFREPGLWETHRTILWLTVGFLSVQSVLIARLFAARRREREAAMSLNLAADAAEIGLWRRSPRSQIFIASPRWRGIFGLPAEGAVTKDDVLSRLTPEDRDRMTESIERSAAENRPFFFEHRVLHPDGTERWVATHGRAEPGHNGSDYGTTGASLDITERREAAVTAALQRQELAHLSRVSSLGVLSGALAHELNQPLGIILSNAQAAEFILDSSEPDLPMLRAILTDIVNEDRRAGDVIKRLRALLRRGETVPQPLDVNQSVREVLKLTRSDLIGRGVSVEQRLAEDLQIVTGDRVQLQQVLLNLITNACDAMAGNEPADRQLILQTSAGEGEVRISVSDLGIGLPDDAERLFDPFHTTKEKGLGMGLAICRTLISAHRGRLWAESNPERGATFHVALPTTAILP